MSVPRCLCRIAVGCILTLPFAINGQDQPVDLPLKEALASLEKREHVKFFYKNDWIKDKRIEAASLSRPFTDFLSIELKKIGIGSIAHDQEKYVYLFNGEPPSTAFRLQSTAGTLVQEQKDYYALTGVIIDAITNEKVVGASVVAEEESVGTVTNSNGSYTLQLPSGVHHIHVTSVGRLPSSQLIHLSGDHRMDVEVYEQTTQLDDIVVLSQGQDRNVTSTEMSQLKMDMKTMKTIPPFMGEVDVIKSILLMPGVSTVGEGASGFNVRGGNVDQNLILLDDTPLFNSSHMFGFFSTFNPDFVKEVTLFKGGMPASFGGRISSVLDVKLKDGNPNKIGVTGGLGIVASRLLVEGPLTGKTSFIVGGRYAYPNWLLKRAPDLNVQKSSTNFYDLNLRVRHQFSDKNSIYFSAYHSNDDFKFAGDTTYGWSTTNFSLRWNTSISTKVFANVTLLTSDYKNSVIGTEVTKEFESDFGIDTRGAKLDFTFLPNQQHHIDFGASRNHYTFHQGELVPGAGSSINPVYLPDEVGVEDGFYISDEIRINNSLSVNAGIRYSLYSVLGSGDVYLYDETVPKSPSTITGTLSFAEGELIKRYDGWEPRLSMKVQLNPRSSIKFSYNRNLQYLQLISNTTAVSPLDLWRTSNYHIKPQIGDQLAVGYFRNFLQNKLEVSVEGYYKRVENMVEYKDGADLFLNPYLESALLDAKGEAYGVELLVRKKEGKLTGWVAYTYARSFRLVDGDTPEETLNFGQKYPSNFDKPHDLSIVPNYAFNRRMTLSANFTYSTGRPITYPESVYLFDGYAVSQFSQRNQARIPDYHRLDISFTIEESLKRTKKWKGSWTFSIYNVYGRANPYSVFFRPQFNGFQTQSYKLAVIGTAFPSITYNFKF